MIRQLLPLLLQSLMEMQQCVMTAFSVPHSSCFRLFLLCCKLTLQTMTVPHTSHLDSLKPMKNAAARSHYTTKASSMVTRRLWLCDVKHKITGLISSHSSPIPLGADIHVPRFLYTSAMFPIQSVHILTFIVGNSPGVHGDLVCIRTTFNEVLLL